MSPRSVGRYDFFEAPGRRFMSSSAREEWHLSPIESPEMSTVDQGANPTPGWRLGRVALTDPLVHLGVSSLDACYLHRERRNSKVSFYPLGAVAGDHCAPGRFDDHGPGRGLIGENEAGSHGDQRFVGASVHQTAALVRHHRQGEQS
jgi:hypothetical protein